MSNAPFRTSDLKIITNPDNDSGLDLYDHGDTSNPIVQIDGTANADGLVRVNSTDGALSAQLFNESSRGAFGAYNAGGSTQLNYVGTDTNGGLSKTTATDGTLSTEIKSDGSSRGEVDVYNAAGNTVQSKLAADANGGVIQTNASDGTKSTEEGSDANKRGFSKLFNAAGDAARYVAEVDSNDQGKLTINDSAGAEAIKATINASRQAAFEMQDAGTSKINLQTKADENSYLNVHKLIVGNSTSKTNAPFEVDYVKSSISAPGSAIYSTGCVIAGGSGHTISGNYNVIAGGILNTISGGDFNFIGGGSGVDIVSGHFASIVGGEDNNITLSDHAFIGGGTSVDVSGSKFSVAVGGFDNDITSGRFSTIGGGSQNSINRAQQAFIGGGGSNEIGSGAAGAAILGGTHNKLGANDEGRNSQSAILAGRANKVSGLYNVVGGGFDNTVSGEACGVFGGRANKVEGFYSTIAGGFFNVVSGNPDRPLDGDGHNHPTGSFIGGGVYNLITGAFSSIISASGSKALADYSFIVGRTGFIPQHHTGAAVFTDGQARVAQSSGQHTALFDYASGVYIANASSEGTILTLGGGIAGTGADGRITLGSVPYLLSGDATSASDTNTFLSSASFNTSNGVLTLTKNDASTVTVDLDGRFKTGINSSDVTSALGLTPISGISSSDVTSALGYTPVDPSTTGALVNDNDISSFITGINSSNVTDALGYVPVNPDSTGNFLTGINVTNITGALGLTPISGISSSDVTSALGYTPVDPSTTGALLNDNDITNFITGINATDVTGALGFNPITGLSSSDVTDALGYTPVNPSTTGALVNDNDIANFISGVSASDVTGALGFNPITGVSSSDVTDALGYTPVDPSTTGALVNDNDIANFISGVSASDVTGALGFNPITGVSSSDVTDALGYTPVDPSTTGALVNNNDIANFITGVSSSDVTSALGYTPVNPSTTGALVNDNDIANFISGVSASDVTGALGFNPITGVSSSDVTDALGYVPVNPSTTGALVNDNDIANFITGINATDVTGALGFNPITGVSSSDVTSALGYTPVDPSTTGALVNDNDIANFISGVSASDVTGALGFNPITGVSSSDVTSALGYTPVDPSTTGALVNNNDIADFITGVSSSSVTDALGFTPLSAEADTLATVTARGASTTDSITTTQYVSGATGLFQDGIGINTTDISSSLTVSATGDNHAGGYGNNIKLNGSNFPSILFDASSNNDFLLGVDGNGFSIKEAGSDARLTINNDGEVGIGTNNPSKPLHVIGDIKSSSAIVASRAEISSDVRHAGDENTKLSFETDTIHLETNGSKRLTVSSDGNVGIGVLDASHKLYVSGEVAGTGAGSRITLNGLPYLLSGDFNDTFTGLSSSNVTNALGYTPVDPSTTGALVNDNDIANFITGVSSSAVTSALGYTPVDPSTTGALVNDNDIADFITGVSSSNVTDALGFTPLSAEADTLATVTARGASTTDSITSTQYISGATGLFNTVTPTTASLHLAGGHILLDNNKQVRFKDSGGTERTIVQLDSSDDLAIGGSYAGALKFIGGGSYSEAMRIHDDGNVGIGTTSPDQSLEVNIGSVSSNESVSENQGVKVVADAGGSIGYAGYLMDLDNSSADASAFMRLSRTSATAFLGLDIGSQSRDGIRFSTHATNNFNNLDEAMRITADGNVGIGMANPSELLQTSGGSVAFHGTASGYVKILKERGDVSHYDDVSSSILAINNYYGNQEYGLYATNSSNFRIQRSGNDGYLELNANDFTLSGIRLVCDILNQAPTNLAINLRDENADEVGFYSPATNEIGFVTDRTERMRIDSNGNVGIGVEDPSHKLYVSGEVAGTGAGSRITLNGLPYLLSGDFNDTFTGLSSSNVTSALGYTPVDPSTTGALVNDNDIANFITGVSSSDVTSALGYTPVDPSTTGALLNNNDIANFITGINSSSVTDALGYVPVDPSTTGALLNNNDIADFITGINSSNVTDALGYTPVNPGGSPTFDSIYLQNTIYHDGDTDNRIDLATDTISFSTAGTTALTVASNSNIGIGTASPNAAHKLHVEGISYARSGVIGTALVGQSPPAQGLIVAGNVGIGTYSATNSLGVYGQANIGTSYQSISAPSNGLIVQGDVGVGSSHPAAKLHVSGAIKGGFHISEKSSDFTLAAAENGSFINGTSTSFDQISISSDLGSDFNCSVMHSTSDVDIVASSSMIVNGVTNGTVTLASGYQPASIVRIASNSYAVFGNLI